MTPPSDAIPPTDVGVPLGGLPATDAPTDELPAMMDVAGEEPIATTVPEGTDLFAFRFTEPLKAQEAMLAVMRLQARGRLKLEDAAIVVKQAGGKVQLIQTRDTNPAQGAASGSWIGMLAGLFVPGGILLGAALGAAVGGIWAKLRDIGIDDDQMKKMGGDLPEGEAALFLLVHDYHRYHVGRELSRFDALLHATTADEECQAWIRDTLMPADVYS